MCEPFPFPCGCWLPVSGSLAYLVQVFCRQPQLLCIQGYSSPVLSRRHWPGSARLLILKILSFPSSLTASEPGGRECDVVISFVVEHATGRNSLQSDLL